MVREGQHEVVVIGRHATHGYLLLLNHGMEGKEYKLPGKKFAQPGKKFVQKKGEEYYDAAKLAAVCLSLYAGSIPQASRNYLFDASEKEKAARVLGLMQSYSQHARMLQALYREVRSSQASAQLDTSGLADSWPSRRPEMGSPVAEFSPEAGPVDASRDADKADASPTDVRAAVREEIRETQAEADERLRKADKTIQALRGMINDKQVELIQRRKEVSRLKHEAESLQLENEKLEVQLSRSSLRGVTAADSVEAANLEKEAEELKTQKEAS
eukprot:g27302.t1